MPRCYWCDTCDEFHCAGVECPESGAAAPTSGTPHESMIDLGTESFQVQCWVVDGRAVHANLTLVNKDELAKVE